MEFEKQKPVSDEYRANWDRLFKPRRTVTVREAFEFCGIPVHIDDSIPKDEVRLVGENGELMGRINGIGSPKYPNGCPILSEEANG